MVDFIGNKITGPVHTGDEGANAIIKDLQQRIAELGAELMHTKQAYKECMHDKSIGRNAELEAENARLREALEEIGDHDCEDIYSNNASCGKCRTCIANNSLEVAGDE